MRHLSDTSALLAYYRNEPGGIAVQALFERDDVVPFVCSITIAEFARRMRDLGADEPSIKIGLLVPIGVSHASTRFW